MLRHLLTYVFSSLLLITTNFNLQAQQSDLFGALVDSMHWSKNLTDFKLEMTTVSTTRANSPSVFEGAAETSSYSDAFIYLVAVSKPSDDRFSLIESIGASHFRIAPISFESTSVDAEDEEVSSTSVILKKNGKLELFDEHKRGLGAREPKGHNDFSSAILILGKHKDLDYFHLTLLNESTVKPQIELLTDLLFEAKDQSKLVDTRHEVVDRQKDATVYRVTDAGEVNTAAYKFVVSDSGPDKGRVIEFSEGFLKDEFKKAKYCDDNQVSDEQSKINTIEWKEFEDKEGQKLLLPIAIRKKATYRLSGAREMNTLVKLEWSGFSSIGDHELKDDFAFKKASEYRKLIDQKLRR